MPQAKTPILVRIQNFAHAALAALAALVLLLEALLEVARLTGINVGDSKHGANAVVAAVAAFSLAASKAVDSASFTALQKALTMFGGVAASFTGAPGQTPPPEAAKSLSAPETKPAPSTTG